MSADTGGARFLADAIERAVSGPVWHGPALADLVGEVSAEQAAAHPVPNAHSIWELVLHMTTWTAIARVRLGGTPMDASPEQDWPPVRDTSPEAWRAAVEALKEAHRALAADVTHATQAALAARVPGRDHAVVTMLHGIVEHDAYHGGQIALLTRALGITA